jgi:hypothetical protein
LATRTGSGPAHSRHDQPPDDVRSQQRRNLSDEAAHRPAEQIHRRQPQRIDELQEPLGEAIDGVRRRARRAAGAAVVEDEHVALGREDVEECRIAMGERPAKPDRHHQRYAATGPEPTVREANLRTVDELNLAEICPGANRSSHMTIVAASASDRSGQPACRMTCRVGLGQEGGDGVADDIAPPLRGRDVHDREHVGVACLPERCEVDDEPEQDARLEVVGDAAVGLGPCDLRDLFACALDRVGVGRVVAAFEALPGDQTRKVGVRGIAVGEGGGVAGRSSTSSGASSVTCLTSASQTASKRSSLLPK